MKNYLLFIIDSLNYSHVLESKVQLMPFLDSIAKQSVVCTSMYSQAPYTEAAVMSTYCGQNVLDYGGYLKRFKNSPTTIFEIMKAHGFTTYYNSLQPQCYPSSLRRGIDYIYYNVGFDLGALWSYRLSHYSSLLSSGLLNNNDINNLIEIFDDNFNEWLVFVENLITKNETCEMICDNALGYDAYRVKREIIKEQATYQKDRQAYIFDVLKKGTSHSIYSIQPFVQNRKIKDREVMPYVRELFLPVLKEIKRMDCKLNLKNNKHMLSGVCKKIPIF